MGIREAVTGLASITEDIQSKTEQVWAGVQGMDGGQVSISADGDKSRDAMANSSTVGLLHNKVDKMIRLMVETSENQKKMNKVLQDLLKSGFVKNESSSTNGGEEVHGDGDKKRKRKERDRSRDRDSEPVSKDKRSRSPDSSIDTQLNVEDVTKANKELTAKLGESEARRMENLLEEADTSKIREAVTGLASITEDIQSKTEQVWAVVQGMDGGQVSISADGDKSRDA